MILFICQLNPFVFLYRNVNLLIAQLLLTILSMIQEDFKAWSVVKLCTLGALTLGVSLVS